MADQRKQLLVDSNVQGGLLRRVAAYWFFCLVSVTMLLFFWEVVVGADPPHRALLNVLARHWPAALASVLILPAVLFDLTMISNRFAGPVARLATALEEAAEGRVQRLRFRDDDYWQELAEKFNAVVQRLEETTGNEDKAG